MFSNCSRLAICLSISLIHRVISYKNNRLINSNKLKLIIKSSINTMNQISTNRIDGSDLVSCDTDNYLNLLNNKVNGLKSLLSFAVDDSLLIDVFESPRSNYRMRANFSIWRDKKRSLDPNDMYYAMFNKPEDVEDAEESQEISNSESKEIDATNNQISDSNEIEEESNEISNEINNSNIDSGKKKKNRRRREKPLSRKGVVCEIQSFPRGSELINSLMIQLMDEFKKSGLNNVIHRGLFEVRFLTTLSGNAVIVLIYHEAIDENWYEEAKKLSERLKGVNIVGRSKKKKLVVGDEIIEEQLTIDGKIVKYYQTEGAFSQPNGKVCEKMIEWALAQTSTLDNKSSDMLELYCGGGTFTAPLSRNFHRVLATELSKSSVELAIRCFESNGINNIKIARLSSEEFTEAYNNNIYYNRLQQADINLKQYDFKVVLVDPPRAGLDPLTCKLISQFDTIVYISCNPETLARDLQTLIITHDVIRLAAFDQFPYTHHLESGVVLKAKAISNDKIFPIKRKLDE